MIEQAALITVWGMGGVFAFLSLLIGAITVLHQIIEETQSESADKIAAAIAAAKAQEE